jgi:hypothetical protein
MVAYKTPLSVMLLINRPFNLFLSIILVYQNALNDIDVENVNPDWCYKEHLP